MSINAECLYTLHFILNQMYKYFLLVLIKRTAIDWGDNIYLESAPDSVNR